YRTGSTRPCPRCGPRSAAGWSHLGPRPDTTEKGLLFRGSPERRVLVTARSDPGRAAPAGPDRGTGRPPGRSPRDRGGTGLAAGRAGHGGATPPGTALGALARP